MNLEYYRNFIKVVEVGTISGAAKELLLAQPALSNQIKALEKNYGTQLFKRGARQITLTSAGQSLYEKAKLICSLENIAQTEIQADILGNRGTLRLGLTPSYPDQFIADLLIEFHELYPHISFDIFEASSDQIMEHLKTGLVEVGVIRTPTYINPIFKSYRAIEEQMTAVYQRDNPWLSPDLATVPIPLLEKIPLSISKGFKQKLTEVCVDNGFNPTILNICSSRATSLMWAERGKAVCIITTASPQSLATKELCCHPLSGGDISTKRSFAVLKERNLSTVAKSFLNFATTDANF